MATWYVRTGGSDLNAGSTDSNTADQSGAAGIVVTATLTEVGAFVAAAASGVINLQDAGNSLIRTYTKVNDDSITLDSAPTSGNGTYAWKIGGARAAIKKVVATGTGNNAKLAAADVVMVAAGTYTENLVTIGLAITVIGVGSVTIDGTGGAGGSDCVVISAGSGRIVNLLLTNAVDRGYSDAGFGGAPARCGATACGGIGFGGTHVRPVVHCYARTCAGGGFASPTNGQAVYIECEAGDNTGIGFSSYLGTSQLSGCLAYDNTGDGFFFTQAMTADGFVAGCTSEGNGGDGYEFTGLPAPGFFFENNVATNNTGTGFKAGTLGTFFVDYNNLSGNGTARTNFPTGTNDTANAPGYVSAAGDDLTLDTGSAMIAAGYTPFKSPMKVNQGATIAEVAGAQPAVGDVRDGVVYGGGTGTLELPAEADVESGVGYGTDGTEFEGTLTGGSDGFLGFPLG